MRVPHHWRMKTQRYRLTGVRNQAGSISFLNRQEATQHEHRDDDLHAELQTVTLKIPVA